MASFTTVVERQLESLTRRDRMLLTGLASFLAIGFVALIWWTVHGVLEDQASRVRATKTQFEAIQSLQAEYQAAAAQVQAQEARLRQYQGKSVSAYIEQLALDTGVEDYSVNSIGTPEDVGSIRQTRYAIDVKKADYEPFFSFLHELETSGFPAHVDQATFKTTYVKRERMLNVRMELIVFSLAGG